jgi:glutaredoxin 3
MCWVTNIGRLVAPINPMAEIIVYSGSSCPFCDKAKLLLKKKGVTYSEVDVRSDEVKLNEMLQKSNGKRTIPQIFINGQHIGGCDDLYALDAAGKLDPLLAG